MVRNKLKKIIGGTLAIAALSIVLMRALFDAYGYVGAFLDFLPPSVARFITSPNGTVFLIVAGLGLLLWLVRNDVDSSDGSQTLAMEILHRRDEEHRAEIDRARPRELTMSQRQIIISSLSAFASNHRALSVHVLHTECFDCGDFARQFQEVFEASGFRVFRHSPGQHEGDDFYYGLHVRWDREWRDEHNFGHDGPAIADALSAAGLEVKLIERAGTFTSLIVGSRKQG